VLFAAVLAASVAASNAFSQSSQGMQNSTAGPKKSSVAAAEPRPNPNWLSRRAEMYYQGVWGVDSFRVKYTESGEIIRFSYRVVDPEKAAALNDKKSEPRYEGRGEVGGSGGVKRRENAPDQHTEARYDLLDGFLELRQAGKPRRPG